MTCMSSRPAPARVVLQSIQLDCQAATTLLKRVQVVNGLLLHMGHFDMTHRSSMPVHCSSRERVVLLRRNRMQTAATLPL